MTRNAIYLPEPLAQPTEDDFPEPSPEEQALQADEHEAMLDLFREADRT